MIRLPAEELGRRAHAFIERVRPQLPPGEVELDVRSGESLIGGGSTPAQHLPSHVITLTCARYSAAQLEARLRQSSVVARVEDDRLVLDLRTVFPEQEPALAAALLAALH